MWWETKSNLAAHGQFSCLASTSCVLKFPSLMQNDVIQLTQHTKICYIYKTWQNHMHQPIPPIARIDNTQSVFYHFSGRLTHFDHKTFLASAAIATWVQLSCRDIQSCEHTDHIYRDLVDLQVLISLSWEPAHCLLYSKYIARKYLDTVNYQLLRHSLFWILGLKNVILLSHTDISLKHKAGWCHRMHT